MKMTAEQEKQYDLALDRRLTLMNEKKIKHLLRSNQHKENAKKIKKIWEYKHPLQYLATLAVKNGITITAFDLWKMAKKQKMKCPYSGHPLIKGSIHLDHIIPKSKGGSNKLNNLQLLPSKINFMKYNLSQKEFVTICKDIASYSNVKHDEGAAEICEGFKLPEIK